MAQEVLALCDGNIHYGSRLAAYLEQQKGFPLRILFYSDVGQLLKCMPEICPQYYLLSEEIFAALSEVGLPAYKRLFLLKSKAIRKNAIRRTSRQFTGISRQVISCVRCLHSWRRRRLRLFAI